MLKRKKIASDYDAKLLAYIQPQGGITFREPNYIIAGDGYIKVIHIYKLPDKISYRWMENILNIPNTIVTIDIGTKDKNVAKKNINQSIIEKNSQISTAVSYDEYYDAAKRKAILEELYKNLDNMGETMKLLHFRIFLMGKSIADIEKQEMEIVSKFDASSYKSAVFLNEGKAEWESMFESIEEQKNKRFAIKPMPLTTEAIALGSPFNYSELIDDKGELLGFTHTNGAVVFDLFTKTNQRLSYNAIVAGAMGSGKSSLLKKLWKANATKGNYVRYFDALGEMTDLTKEFGGVIVSCDGKNGIINPFEILKTDEDNNISYSNHINKLRVFFQFLGGLNIDQLTNLEIYLKEFYEEKELSSKYGNITGLNPKKYPILIDFIEFLEKRLSAIVAVSGKTVAENSLLSERAIKINDILSVARNACENYGHLFNGYTSVRSIDNEKIVTFNIKNIIGLGDVFKAIMFNYVSLCFNAAIKNGEIMKDLWERNEIADEDIIKSLIFIDEAHEWVNVEYKELVQLLNKFERESRKYFAGTIYASQSLGDYTSSNSSDNMKTLEDFLALKQYKFIFKQDTSNVNHVSDIFKGSLTPSHFDAIPNLDLGECILSIAGDKSISFKVWLSKEYEMPLFKGGM